MSAIPFADLSAVAAHLRTELATKKFILLYAYNGTGKTRLSATAAAQSSPPRRSAGRPLPRPRPQA